MQQGYSRGEPDESNRRLGCGRRQQAAQLQRRLLRITARVSHAPVLELLLRGRRDPPHVVGLIGRARTLSSLISILKRLSRPTASNAPSDAGAQGARSAPARHRWRRSAEEGHRDAGTVVQVTDDAETAALACEAHDRPRDSLGLFLAAPLASKPP